MAIHGSKVQKLTSLIKKTAQKLVKSPKTVNKELKKLALTLPLMALLIEEVRAAQNKVGIDAMAISGAVFEDEAALAEFIEQQNLDEEQYTELEEELDGILLAQADTPKEEDDDKGAYITRDGGAAGEQGFGSQSGSIAAEEGAQTAAAGADESFELAGFIIPFAPAPFIASGVAVGAVVTGVLNNGTEPALVVDATGTDLTTSLKDLQRLGIDFVNPAAGENTINLSLGDGATLTNGSAPVLFGDTNLDGVISEAEDAATNVTLTINSAQQLAEIAGVTNLASLGVDNIRLDLPGQASLNTLLADPTLAADLAAIRNSGLTIDTIDMGAATSISQAQAATLLSSGLRRTRHGNP